MEKKEYITPQISVVQVAPQTIICVSLSPGNTDDETVQPDTDEEDGTFLAE